MPFTTEGANSLVTNPESRTAQGLRLPQWSAVTYKYLCIPRGTHVWLCSTPATREQANLDIMNVSLNIGSYFAEAEIGNEEY
jgi:hypothetical protein